MQQQQQTKPPGRANAMEHEFILWTLYRFSDERPCSLPRRGSETAWESGLGLWATSKVVARMLAMATGYWGKTLWVGCGSAKINPDGTMEYGESEIRQSGKGSRFTLPVDLAQFDSLRFEFKPEKEQ